MCRQQRIQYIYLLNVFRSRKFWSILCGILITARWSENTVNTGTSRQIEIHFLIWTTKMLMKYNLFCFQTSGRLIIFFNKHGYQVSTSLMKENKRYKWIKTAKQISIRWLVPGLLLTVRSAGWCSNEANMLHPTMLDDVWPTCWLHLSRPWQQICKNLSGKETYITNWSCIIYNSRLCKVHSAHICCS